MSEMNVYQALLAAQRNFGPVVKNATNPAFKTKYADLGAVLDAITAPLNDAGLLLVQRFAVDAGGPVLVTEVIHAASGATISSTVPITGKDPTNPQAMGGAITYYRRYSLMALLGLAAEDDDGNAAAKPAAPAPERRTVIAEGYKPRPAPRSDDELLAIAADTGAMLPRREHAAKAYLGRATDPFAAEERAAAVRRIEDFDGRDVDAWRDAALGALREKQPASYAG
jgi:hypothetical protein